LESARVGSTCLSTIQRRHFRILSLRRWSRVATYIVSLGTDLMEKSGDGFLKSAASRKPGEDCGCPVAGRRRNTNDPPPCRNDRGSYPVKTYTTVQPPGREQRLHCFLKRDLWPGTISRPLLFHSKMQLFSVRHNTDYLWEGLLSVAIWRHNLQYTM
jgi:hypothetical protein